MELQLMARFQGLVQGRDGRQGEGQPEEVALQDRKTLTRIVIAVFLMVRMPGVDTSRHSSNTQMIYRSYAIILKRGSSKRSKRSTNGSII